ncbi:unnamed protein product [Litomosoides sigmodontis]|uniref:Uncharacterized protein n=1 Tax=Litomosoides sigmodontis TaxID=42156 RepID=A0A3P6TWB7_LITSI|nr:unnamed protein product [Litomosoides sigmodontis]
MGKKKSYVHVLHLIWSAKLLQPRSRYAAGFERVWTLILAWKPKKNLKISPEEYIDGSSPPSDRTSRSVKRELCIALLSSDPIPRPGSTQIKLDVNAEPPWDPDPLY